MYAVMKTYFFLFAVVLCCLFSFYTIKKANSLQQFNTFCLANINTLADAEEGPTEESESGSGTSYCETRMTSSYAYQDCQGQKRYYRTTLEFKCEGNAVGLCIEGVEYFYYDCDELLIKRDARTEGKSCK